MYLVKIPNKKTGRVFLQISESKRVKDEKTGKSKPVQVLVMPIGYVDELLDQYEDPIAHFEAVAKQMTEEQREQRKSRQVQLDPQAKLVLAEQLSPDDVVRKNIGYAAFSLLYHQLEIDYFINNRRRYKKFDANLNVIFKMLVFGRLLWPSSKQASWQKRGFLFEDGNYPLESVYRALDYFLEWRPALMAHLHDRMQAHYGRDVLLYYYDVTNYYFEIDEPDELRRKGVSKEHRATPIVQMGLLMDESGLPITYDLYRGNANDSTTFPQILDDTMIDLGLHHRIVVADKGMITGDNIATAILAHNGYVFSDSLKRVPDPMVEWALRDDESDDEEERFTKIYDKDENLIFMYKEREWPHIISVTSLSGKKEDVQINERQVVIYSAKYAARAKEKRGKAVAKAEKRIMSRSRDAKADNFGSAKYIKKVPLNTESGELEMERTYLTLLDEKRIAEEERFDGFYLIRSNVIGLKDGEGPMKSRCKFTSKGMLKLNQTVTSLDILDMYKGLWRIEETFKVTKSQLKARPVFVSTENHIRSHFLICFVSLLLMRVLEYRMDWKHSAAQIQRTLKAASGTLIADNLYVFDHYDRVLQDIGENLDLDFSRQSMSRGEIRSFMASTKKT